MKESTDIGSTLHLGIALLLTIAFAILVIIVLISCCCCKCCLCYKCCCKKTDSEDKAEEEMRNIPTPTVKVNEVETIGETVVLQNDRITIVQG